MENNEYVQFQPTKEQEKINKINLHNINEIFKFDGGLYDYHMKNVEKISRLCLVNCNISAIFVHN